MSNEAKWGIGLVVVLLVLCACLTVACLVAGGVTYWAIQTASTIESTEYVWLEEDPFPVFETPTPTAAPLNDQQPAKEDAFATLKTLEDEEVPINDPRDLAARLGGVVHVPEIVDVEPEDLQVGDEQVFWASNVDTNENFQVTATLAYETDHLYFFIENGVRYDEDDLRELAETFENEIYPTNRDFFGSEWTPGVDNDPHLYVLYATGLGNSIAGYFSSADELHPLAHEYSNAHEMFMINADTVFLFEDYIYSTVAHEFQHMIHWYRDRNEESWVNEGFSVLAEFLNGYDIGGFDYLYVSNPDIQLTHWPEPPNSTPHYGASYLFLAYFLDRFDDEATQTLVAHPDNGMDSIDAVLADLDAVDPMTGEPVRADDVFADWVVTSYLNDPDVMDGRFAYQRYENAPQASDTEKISNCPINWETRTVNQYGVDYIRIRCSGEYTLHFQGATEVKLLPVDPFSGDYAFWSNKGDESDMTLTQEFDFTGVDGPLTLTYQTWYDIEEDYDYVYLSASDDGGDTWQILTTPSGTDEDPSGNSYGWGYNGYSDGWIEESVDLSDFAGKIVQLRFEYVTDAAVNGQGLMLDDIRIDAIGYSSDFEDDEGGWIGEGFVRIQNRLPQTYRVTLIKQGSETTVEKVVLDERQTAEITLDLGGEVDEVVLVVSGVTRFTTQPASYRFQIK